MAGSSASTKAGKAFRLARGANAALFTLFAVGMVVLLNVVAARFPLRVDWSVDRRFQLAPQTKEAIARLKEPVDIYAFVLEGAADTERLTDLLREYRLASPKVRMHVVDPEKEPSLAQSYGVRASGTVVVKMGDAQRKIEFYNMFVPSLDGSSEFRGEQAITRALLELDGHGGATVYFVEGHGEGGPFDDYSELRTYLEGEGYSVKTLNLALHQAVPDDARAVILAGPKADLVPKERQMLEAYLDEDGRIALWLDPLPPGQERPELERLLESLDVALVPGIVVDPERALFGDALSPVPEIRWHDITSPLIQANTGVVLPGAVAVRQRGDEPDASGQAGGSEVAVHRPGSARVVPLLVTTGGSWAESDPQAERWSRGPADAAGPLDVAVAVERDAVTAAATAPASSPEAQPHQAGAQGSLEAAQENPATRPVAVVVGSSAFARNASFAFQGNRDFAANAVTWLTGQGELVTIRPSSAPVPRVLLTGRQAVGIFYGATVGLPVLVLAAGIAVWWRRRAL